MVGLQKALLGAWFRNGVAFRHYPTDRRPGTLNLAGARGLSGLAFGFAKRLQRLNLRAYFFWLGSFLHFNVNFLRTRFLGLRNFWQAGVVLDALAEDGEEVGGALFAEALPDLLVAGLFVAGLALRGLGRERRLALRSQLRVVSPPYLTVCAQQLDEARLLDLVELLAKDLDHGLVDEQIKVRAVCDQRYVLGDGVD